jgi:hypothetical protein
MHVLVRTELNGKIKQDISNEVLEQKSFCLANQVFRPK